MFCRMFCLIVFGVFCIFSLSAAIALKADTQNGDVSANAEDSSNTPGAPGDPNTPQDTPPQKQTPTDPNRPLSEQADEPEKEDEENDSMFPDAEDMAELFDLFGQLFNDQLVSKTGMVDYATLRRKRIELIGAARLLENLHPAVVMSLNPNERIAFWINTYNTCTLKLIVDNYPIQAKWYMILYPSNSIMQIPGAWDKVFFRIMGLEYNLKEIRNDLLLNRFKDPRICFALTDAARGGAMLRNEPFLPDKLDKQLDDQVRRFLTSMHGFRMDTQSSTLYLSSVFVINKNAFLNSEYAEILRFRTRKTDERAWFNFIYNFLPSEDAAWLEANGSNVVVRFIDFDWTLNEK